MPRVLCRRQLQDIIDFAKKKSKTNDFNHNISHIELTAKIAGALAKYEKADAQICAAAAYLHDIGRAKAKGKHGARGAKIARAFLKKMRLPVGFIHAVCYAIAEHDRGAAKSTKEAAVLWDADKLQSIGPLGFMRIFAHHLLYDTRDIFLAKGLTKDRHNFFYQRFQTSTARALAKKLHSFMDEFYYLMNAVKSARLKKIL